jgi:hypothetical protein
VHPLSGSPPATTQPVVFVRWPIDGAGENVGRGAVGEATGVGIPTVALSVGGTVVGSWAAAVPVGAIVAEGTGGVFGSGVGEATGVQAVRIRTLRNATVDRIRSTSLRR